MAEVTGFTADRMKAIEDSTVVTGHVNEAGELILTTRDSSIILAGYVIGPPGPPGSGGGDPESISYTHDQSTPSDNWLISHNLGFRPNLTVIDSAGSNVIGYVEHISSNQLRVTFSAAFSGVAYLS